MAKNTAGRDGEVGRGRVLEDTVTQGLRDPTLGWWRENWMGEAMSKVGVARKETNCPLILPSPARIFKLS